MDGARVDYYSIINKGPKPILPSDFIAPLSIDTPSDGGILLVDSCAQPSQGSQKQTSSSSSSSSCKPGSFVTTTWSEQENQWIQERALLNPDELFCVVVIQKAGAQNLHWSGRIAGSKIAHYANFEEYENSLEKKLPYYFETSIHLEGLAAYWFAILQVSGLYSTLLLARQAKWPSSAGALWPTIVATLLATSTAEIMVDIFINDNRTRLSPVVWPLLFGHAALIVLLLVRALKVRLGKGLIP
ncbi:hypothetical protein [Aquabacterium sp.]|uniref:hypothetical protein n=1 Tax=Aquabacterium sp. TaxID=1872578 RepID=UPI003D6D7DC8